MQEFYIAREGEAIGPVSVEETDVMLRDGRLGRDTLVWDEVGANWVLAADHPVISTIFTRTTAPVSSYHVSMTVDPAVAAEANADLARLESQIAEAESALTQRRKEVAECEQRIAAAKSEADAAHRAAEAAAREREEGETTLRLLEERLKNFEREAGAQAKAEEERAAAVEDEIEELTRDLAKRREELADAEKKAHEAAAATEALSRRNTEIEQRRGEAEQALQEAERKQAEAEKRAAAIAAEIESRREAIAAEIRSLEKGRGDLETEMEARLAEAARARDALGAEIADLARRKDELEESRRATERESSAARQELDALVIRRSACDAEIRLIAERLGAVKAETAELEQKRLEAQALLGEEVSAAFTRIRGTVDNLTQLTEAWSTAQREDAVTRREGLSTIESLTASLRQRESDLDAAQRLAGKKSELETAVTEARAQLAETRRQADDSAELLRQTTSLCWQESERIVALRKERMELDEAADAAAERRRIAERRLTELASETEPLVNRLAALRSEQAALQGSLDIARRDVEMQEAAIAELKELRGRTVESCLEAEKELARLRARLAEEEAACAQAEARRTAATAAVDRLKAEQATAEAEIERLRSEGRSVVAESEAMRAMAEEARREVEAQLEEMVRQLAARRDEVALAEERRAAAEKAVEAARAERNRLTEATNETEATRKRGEAEARQAAERLVEINARLEQREKAIGAMRETEGEVTARCRRLSEELQRLAAERSAADTVVKTLEERIKGLDAEMVALEQERAARSRADLKDLRDLLRERELREKQHIEKLLIEARTEFMQLQEDWTNEERAGITNEDLKKIRSEVEDRRRELAKAERQLSAMRAGLSKLREENGRNLLQRVQSFEAQQLEDLRRRIAESKTEIEALEKDWNREQRSAELIDRQWFEVASAIDGNKDDSDH